MFTGEKRTATPASSPQSFTGEDIFSLDDRKSTTELDHRVQVAIGILADSAPSNGRLVTIARSVNLSESRLRHLIRREIGLSPGKYRRLLKMREARRLLIETFMSVKEIAYKAGFNDISHFVRDFRHLFGKSPSAYRRHVAHEHTTKSAKI